MWQQRMGSHMSSRCTRLIEHLLHGPDAALIVRILQSAGFTAAASRRRRVAAHDPVSCDAGRTVRAGSFACRGLTDLISMLLYACATARHTVPTPNVSNCRTAFLR